MGETTITVNGSPRPLQRPAPLREVLESLDLPALERGIAVSLNGEVVRRADWEQRRVSPGDHLEVVQATQGG